MISIPTKNKKHRVIRLGTATIKALNVHRERQDKQIEAAKGHWRDPELVFASTIGTSLDPSNLVARSFKPLLKRAGLPDIRFHDLRHTCATLLLSEGVLVKVVQEILGHSSVSVTMDVYSHDLPDMQEISRSQVRIPLPPGGGGFTELGRLLFPQLSAAHFRLSAGKPEFI